MDQREIRLGCLKIAATIAPKESSPYTLKQAALDLERFVMAEGTADEVGKALTDARMQAELRTFEAARRMHAMSTQPARKFGEP